MATNFSRFQDRIREELERARNDDRLNRYCDSQRPADEAYPDAISISGGYFDPKPHTTNIKIDK